MYDRLRAQTPPPTAEGWQSGVVRRVDRREARYVVTVAPDDGNRSVEVTVSDAVYDLFTGRLDRAVETPADVAGATVWFK
ncbi:DUF7861 family protein [Halomarina litorea]|uniref:DUF7861 family protein n=1 Tax=Halomarina litorea TaxID=2961595 RepID=UPI0020C1F35B|nr:hypothetical protein [Halomarina sp. BCD28]